MQQALKYSVAYTDCDMAAFRTGGAEVELKWRFNTDDTIEMCVCLNKRVCVGIGFGQGTYGVDMFAINIIDGAAELLDLYKVVLNQTVLRILHQFLQAQLTKQQRLQKESSILEIQRIFLYLELCKFFISCDERSQIMLLNFQQF